MKRILTALAIAMVSLMLFSLSGMAQTSDARVMSFNIRYLGFDENYNSYKLFMNISVDRPGQMVYLEEYYTVDSYDHPKFVGASGRFYNGELIQNGTSFNASFETLRPVSHGGKTFTLVKAIILLDGQRIFETWLTRDRNFIDNTDSGMDDSQERLTSDIENIDKYEIRERSITASGPTTFEYIALNAIYEINVTGTGNDNAQLRVEILKSRPRLTERPSGIIYKYIDISSDSHKIKEISPKYKIEHSWVANNSVKLLGMMRWDNENKKWIALSTKRLRADDSYVYFESVSTNLSTFVIVGFTAPKAPVNNSTSQNNGSKMPNTNNTQSGSVNMMTDTNEINGTTDTESDVKEPLIKNIPGFEAIMAIAIFLLLNKRIKKGG